MRVSDALRLGLAVAAGQRDLNDTRGHEASIFALNLPGVKPLGLESPGGDTR